MGKSDFDAGIKGRLILLKKLTCIVLIPAALFLLLESCSETTAGRGKGGDGGSLSDGSADSGEDAGGKYDAGWDGNDAGRADDLLPDAGNTGADGGMIPDGGDGGQIGGDQAQECPSSEPFDYSCDPQVPETCPGGMCMLNLCIGPVLDPDRWESCGSGTCDRCEAAETCPADCGAAPPMTGSKEYDDDTTITVWVHGFSNKSPDEMAGMVYGEDGGCGDMLEAMQGYGVNRLCGNTPAGEAAPNQLTKLEYYGGVPAAWMTEADVAEIEQYSYDGITALHRYALILAKYIRHKIDVTGATHVNLACHSMGCYIIRYTIENNIGNLAAENRFVRWFSSAGVIAGARLARLFDNPSVREGAEGIGLELSDFVIMNPDYAMDAVASWDHKLWEGNNPLFAGMIIHHGCSTDPHIEQAFGMVLLDLNNPGDEPNDGIMYTFDEFFHSQQPDASFHAPGGEILTATHNYSYVDHMNYPETEAAKVLATATLFHRRKVYITLGELELFKDREHHEAFDGEQGDPPAEISVEAEVRYNPFISSTYGKDVVVHDDKIDYRTPDVFQQEQGQILQPGLTVFAGPVFDQMDSLRLDMKVLEVDWYKRFDVREWIGDTDEELIGFHDQVPLTDNSIDFQNEYCRCRLDVKVVDQY